jgi:hypothetical protein
MNRSEQHGLTLIVSLIMLIVLTLLVVSAIRFGNINLRIANNAQSEVEANAAAQVAIEQTLSLINAASNPAEIAAQPQLSVSTGGTTIKVAVAAPACKLSKNIVTTELDPGSANDQPCFEGPPPDPIFDKDGKPVGQPTACKDQQWDVTASVDDGSTGAKLTMLQGVAMRVSADVTCP